MNFILLQSLWDGQTPGPGAQVMIHDEDWLIQSEDSFESEAVNYQSICEGIFELVNGHEAKFLTELDRVDVIDPIKTRLELDEAGAYIDLGPCLRY